MEIRWEVVPAQGTLAESYMTEVEAHGDSYRVLVARDLSGYYDLTVHRVAGRHRDLVDAVLARGEIFASFEEAEQRARELIEADAP